MASISTTPMRHARLSHADVSGGCFQQSLI
jgi:hypothetical protein